MKYKNNRNRKEGETWLRSVENHQMCMAPYLKTRGPCTLRRALRPSACTAWAMRYIKPSSEEPGLTLPGVLPLQKLRWGATFYLVANVYFATRRFTGRLSSAISQNSRPAGTLGVHSVSGSYLECAPAVR